MFGGICTHGLPTADMRYFDRATPFVAGDAGRPPALPRGGRAHLLLAAARKAQTAAFPTADPCLCEPSQAVMSQVWAP